ncbi:hypothetical protein AVEN_118760-1 [Araneus ventricosus]|uniref:Uncharacterized protein n=1 Tax=Araneus ventricosus TaxID=182803 RepID=A0A4Y2BXC2_ARAVE|nr:hypothetical protein AVEN_118760-1 [Araneus ventricosus]
MEKNYPEELLIGPPPSDLPNPLLDSCQSRSPRIPGPWQIREDVNICRTVFESTGSYRKRHVCPVPPTKSLLLWIRLKKKKEETDPKGIVGVVSCDSKGSGVLGYRS